MTASVDWVEVAVVLTAAAREPFARFLAGPEAKQVYAVGLFFDPLYGNALTVANTIDCHLERFRSFIKEYGPTDEPPYMRDCGNWKYPAGVPPAEAQFRDTWSPTGLVIGEAMVVAIAEDKHDEIVTDFRRVCVEVLRWLTAERVFAPATELLGYVVQSPHDTEQEVVANQERVTAAVRGGTPGLFR